MSFREIDDLPDIRELTYEKTPTGTVRSLEELSSLYGVDENLDPIERAVHLLSSGHDLQRVSVVSSLPELFRERLNECSKRVFPKVKELLYISDEDLQLAASISFRTLLTKQILVQSQWIQLILPSILQGLENKQLDIIELWLDSLLICMESLTTEAIIKDLLPAIKGKCNISRPASLRIACCKIVGKMSQQLESNCIKNNLMKLVQTLCQDIEQDVRRTMCTQLPILAKRLSGEALRNQLLPELVELCKDECLSVRSSALESASQLMVILDNETAKSNILPVIINAVIEIQNSEDPCVSGQGLAKHFGQLVLHSSNNSTEEQKRLFLDIFRQLSKAPSPAKSHASKPPIVGGGLDSLQIETPAECCRRCCAESIPFLAKAYGLQIFKSDLMPIWKSLCTDSSFYVRSGAASSLSRLIVAFQPSLPHTMFITDFSTFLRDQNISVLKKLVETCYDIYRILPESGRWEFSNEVINATVVCLSGLMATHDWRCQQKFIGILGDVSFKIFSSDQIAMKLLPAVYKELITHRALPVRDQTAKTMLILLRYNRRLDLKSDYYKKIFEDMAHSPNYRNRALFIDTCYHVLHLYSRSFFRQYQLIDLIIEKCSDHVANIRIHVCRLLPSIKGLLSLPNDRPILSQLESVVRKLQSDPDDDVVSSINSVVHILDKTKPYMESLTKKIPKESVDAKKEEEERLIFTQGEEEAAELEKARRESITVGNVQASKGISTKQTMKLTTTVDKKSANRKTQNPKPSVSKTNPQPSVPRRGSGLASASNDSASGTGKTRRTSTGSFQGNISSTNNSSATRKKSISGK